MRLAVLFGAPPRHGTRHERVLRDPLIIFLCAVLATVRAAIACSQLALRAPTVMNTGGLAR
jgi:hypothetical protein